MLTKPEHLDYREYIERMDNSWAIDVKISDLCDNLSPDRMKLLPPADRERLCKKYYAALDVLEGRKF